MVGRDYSLFNSTGHRGKERILRKRLKHFEKVERENKGNWRSKLLAQIFV